MTNVTGHDSIRRPEAVTDFQYQWSPITTAVSAQISTEAADFSQTSQVGSATCVHSDSTPAERHGMIEMGTARR